ncbi:ras-related protein Rab-44 isoform X1 [Prinia subflava]|uniref:ras-related protein Rab-44 isoform X1 n=1 Tax=Prinia subflava TaxID=208062 RepID=UPI002FE16492
MQEQEEAESLDTIEHQSSGGNVQLIAEGDELKSASAQSTEAALQPLSQSDDMGTEQGGGADSDVHPLDQGDKEELVELEAEDSWTDSQLCVSASPENPQGGGHSAALQPRDGAGDWGQAQGGHGLMQELVPHPSGVTTRHRGGTDAGVQPVEEVVILHTGEGQSSGANVQLIAEGDELRLSPGGSTGGDLQPLGEAGSSGTEQRGSVDSEVQPLDQVNKAESVQGEAENGQADLQLCGGFWAEKGREGERAVQIEEDEEEDGAQEQGEHGLPQEPELHLQGSGVRQAGGAGEDMQAQEEAEIPDTPEHQSSGANVQLIAEGEELRLSPGGSTETDLPALGEAGSSGTEQGGGVDSEVQPLDQEDKAEFLGREAEDVQEDRMSHEGLSPGAPRVWEGERAVQLEEEEDEAQGQGEHGLSHEPVLGLGGARGPQGEGAGAGVQPQEEAESLHTLEAQSTDADVQLFTDQQKAKSGSGGSTEADLTPLGVAGMWEGQQSLTLGLEAGLGAFPTANPWEGAAAADVPAPAEAALCPGPVTAAEGPGLEAKLGACIGPEGQILEAQELLQGERAAAEGKPHGLEVAQGERLEAGVRTGVKTQGLRLNQGHEDAVFASLVSEVPLQISPLKLETMMQEDVLIPDVWRLCAPGQAAQRELQEQVSAQGHEGKLHTVAQQPEGDSPPTTEPEHTAAGPAGRPREEVPPASTLHTTAQPGDAGRDQLGMVLRENSLGQRQLLGEQSKHLGVGQRENMQEFGQKMSQEGEPSPGKPGAVTAGGAGAAPGVCPKAPLDPEHLYNVLFVGDSHVGKTSFLYRLHADTFNPQLSATVGMDYHIKNLVVDNKCFALRLWDSAGQERYRSVTRQFFRKADGVVLMYDITSEHSFSDVRYWLGCVQEAAEDGVAVLLLGNKTDCAAQRQVPTKEGECLAKEHQLMFYECSAASGHNVLESMVSFVRLLKVREDEMKNKAEEVPEAPQKKKGCCW